MAEPLRRLQPMSEHQARGSIRPFERERNWSRNCVPRLFRGLLLVLLEMRWSAIGQCFPCP